MMTSIDRLQNPAPKYSVPGFVKTDRSGPGQRLLIWGRFFVFNGKVSDLTIHLDSTVLDYTALPRPKLYLDDVRCVNLKVFQLAADGNCEAGCGVSCQIPSGQSKDVVITVRSEVERVSNSHFRINYAVPTITKALFASGTKGTEELIIEGTNFGFNASVMVGNARVHFDGPECRCPGGLVCGTDLIKNKLEQRSCFLPKLSQTHSEIRVLLPGGVGTNIPFDVHVVNQRAQSLLNFEPPEINKQLSGLKGSPEPILDLRPAFHPSPSPCTPTL